MWVVNQDGLAVVQVGALALDPAEVLNFNPKDKDHNIIRIWGSISDHDFVMGVYYDVEEAKEVLNAFVNHTEMYVGCAYRMPKAIKQLNEVQ